MMHKTEKRLPHETSNIKNIADDNTKNNYILYVFYFMRQSFPVFYMIFHKAVSSHLSIDKFDIYFKQSKET